MSDYDNNNQGAIFKNDKKENENQPDYRGSINTDGTDYWLSAWIKTAKSGVKYMSLSVQKKEQRANTDQYQTQDDPDSPF